MSILSGGDSVCCSYADKLHLNSHRICLLDNLIKKKWIFKHLHNYIANSFSWNCRKNLRALSLHLTGIWAHSRVKYSFLFWYPVDKHFLETQEREMPTWYCLLNCKISYKILIDMYVFGVYVAVDLAVALQENSGLHTWRRPLRHVNPNYSSAATIRLFIHPPSLCHFYIKYNCEISTFFRIGNKNLYK